jgi:hypothetical protein
MISHRILRRSLAGLLVSGALFDASVAAADPAPCTQSSDCSKGFTCQVVGGTACPAYACPVDIDGQACQTPPCTPQMIMGCVPGPCNTDSDCATGMVCYADSYENCPAPAPTPLPSCPPNADCAVPVTSAACPPDAGADCASPAPDAGACTTAVVKSCVPRYDLPCKVSSDCGDGFTCVPDTETTCSGSGFAGSAGPGSATTGGGVVSSPPTTTSPPPTAIDASTDPPSCTTTTLTTSSCQANQIACTTNSDCPSTWTCVAEPQAVSNGCAGPIQTLDSGTPPPVCGGGSPPPAQMLCQPPYTNSPGVGFASGATNGGGATVPPTAGPGSGADPAGKSAAPGAASSPPPGDTAGCQVAAPGTGGGSASLLVLLGLSALGRSSRRRRE